MKRPDWLSPEVLDVTWERVYLPHRDDTLALVDHLIERGWLIPADEHRRHVKHATRGAVVMAEGRAEAAEAYAQQLRDEIPETARRNARQLDAVQSLIRHDRKTVPMAALQAALEMDGES